MDLSVYLVTATIAVFTVGAVVGLWYSVTTGQWKNLDSAARSVLDFDDPLPVRSEGAR